MQAAHIIVFVFIIGGAFAVVQKTGAIAVGATCGMHTFANKPHLQKFFIPVTMTFFSVGGTVFGMSEETMPFVLIFIPLSISLGYDSLVGTAIPFLGAAAGFAGATLNPFTVGIAQGIAELPLYSGLEYRIVIWVISTVAMITFVMLYAAKSEGSLRQSGRRSGSATSIFRLDAGGRCFTMRQKVVLMVFVLTILCSSSAFSNIGYHGDRGLFLALGIVSVSSAD
jgi:uncharacterized ion transporter superfamily protein YfcC